MRTKGAGSQTMTLKTAVRNGAVMLVVMAMFAIFSGCGANLIPNTDVPNTAENREVVDFAERYRQAIQERNAARLLGLVSDQYFDDNGTLEGDDDMDYQAVQETLARWNEDVRDVRYEVRYRRVTRSQDRVFVDYTYTGSFKLRTPNGDRWSRRLADNRLELIRLGDGYKVIAGL